MHNRVQSCVATLAFREGDDLVSGGVPYRCGANMVWRLPCSCSPSAASSPLGIGRGAAGSYSKGVLRPTRFAVALMRSSWVISCVGLYRSTNSCEAVRHPEQAAGRQRTWPSLPPSRASELLTLWILLDRRKTTMFSTSCANRVASAEPAWIVRPLSNSNRRCCGMLGDRPARG